MHAPASQPASSQPSALRANPVLWLVIALPLLAVVASFGSLAVAVTRGDRELPTSYHWEGNALDRDDAARAAAAALGLHATLRVDAASQRCLVSLQGAAPPALRLDLTHPTDQAADRHLLLQRAGDLYSAPCAGLSAAHWWLQLADPQGKWLLRARVDPSAAAPATAGAPGAATTPLSATLP